MGGGRGRSGQREGIACGTTEVVPFRRSASPCYAVLNRSLEGNAHSVPSSKFRTNWQTEPLPDLQRFRIRDFSVYLTVLLGWISLPALVLGQIRIGLLDLTHSGFLYIIAI
jgi:hypothetical protein